MLKKTLVIALVGLMLSGVVVGTVSLAERATPSGGRGQEQATGARADLPQGQGRGQRVEVSEGVAGAFGGRNFEAETEDCDCENCISNDGNKGQGQMPSGRSASGRGSEQGKGQSATELASGARGTGQAVGAQGAVQGSGRYATEQAAGAGNSVEGQGGRGSGGSGSGSQAELVEQITVESTVVALDEHIIIKLADGTELELGMGPTFYREEIGFATEVEAELTVTGFHEDGEFKVLSIVDESGTEYLFRDEYGRPEWSGRGNRKNSVS